MDNNNTPLAENNDHLKNEHMNEIMSLSKQEKKILVALSYGSLYKEIAEDYHISINTVKKHLKNIYRKLKVDKRAKAVEKLFEAGPLLADDTAAAQPESTIQ